MRNVPILLLLALCGLTTRAPAAAATTPATMSTTDSPLGAATLVTLDVNDEPIQSVLQQISGASGMTVKFEPTNPRAASPRITLVADGKPFWEVIDAICNQCNCDCSTYNQQVQIQTHNMGPRPAVNIAGALRFSASRIEHICDLTAADSDYCVVHLSAMWEPKLKPLFYANAILPRVAEDETGASLVPPADARLDDPRQPIIRWLKPDHFTMMANGFSHQADCTIRIAAPAASAGRHIALLEGVLRLWAADQSDTFQVDALEETAKTPKTTTLAGGMKIAVRQDNPKEIQVGVTRQGESDAQWKFNQQRIQLSSLWVIDAGGQKSLITSHGEMWNPREHWATFSLPQPAAKVIAEIPRPTELDIPFTFRGLPLP